MRHVELPTGLSGTIRPMKGAELQLFVNPALLRDLTMMDKIFAGCWTETANFGPYPTPKGTATGPNWENVALGDRHALLMQLRSETYGETYEFSVRCQVCPTQYAWELSLLDLPIKPFPEASIEALREGRNRFEVQIPTRPELTLVYKIATGKEERQIANMKGAGPLGPVDALIARTIEILTTDPPKAGSPAPVDELGRTPFPGGITAARRVFEELDAIPLDDLRIAMEEVDGGVETRIETVCTKCAWKQEIELPFQGSFFARSRAKKATKS